MEEKTVGAPMNLPPVIASYVFNLILCLLPIVMNSSPTGHRAEDGHAPNHNRPFFFQPMPTPHMFTPPVSHFMHPPAFHPYFYPTVEIGGGLYYPVCPMPYPRGFGPQSPITHTNYRRPFLNSSLVARPTFYHSTRFRHYPFRKNVTNTEVQTDSETKLEQAKRTDVSAETSAAPEARVQKSSGIETNSDSTAVPAQERVSHKAIGGELNETEETSSALAPKSTKPGGYAFQKEKIRIECNEGAPSINVWRSFEATVPIYNPTPNKGEDRIQCEMWSLSACEGGVPFYGPFEPDKMIPKTELRKEVLLDSTKSPGSGRESKATGDEVSRCVAPSEKVGPAPGKTNGSRKCPTNTRLHELPEQPAHQRSPRGLSQTNGIGVKDETRNRELLLSPGSPNDDKMGEGSKSDASLESIEEYVPSASVLAWLQNQARTSRGKASLPIPRHPPGVLQGSFEEMSSKDEESSFDFFDAMPGGNQVSYTHLMCNPRRPPVPQVLSTSKPRSGNKTLESPLVSRQKRVCSVCQKETFVKAKSASAGCRTLSPNRDVGSDAPSERDHFSKDQSVGGNSGTSGRRKYRRVSRESSSSNKNKKTRYSSDSEQASEDQDNEARAENVNRGGPSRRKIVRRTSKVSSTTQSSSRPQPEKPRAKKKTLDAAKYPLNQREHVKAGNEHSERQKLGQTAKPERKRKEEEKRRKSTRKAMSVQNGSEESVDEYWNKVGAKPKSATSHGDVEHETLQQNAKANCKPVPVKKGTREFNEMETWDSSCLHGFQGNSLRRRTRKKC
ncbi:uncharacterized protein LOC122549283 isoform X2 [Chiloscyllium plagiosum]|uniref:uncharacterized protein LOC122549283 isoform X2 n=1 Tax=Chiloscyllium plagiosum TaxID=36176 RepID=UPI001CB86F81|nr:uncharacterized protein LOC122549283 isoform X2 [Chiloscyllium plagiosum]